MEYSLISKIDLLVSQNQIIKSQFEKVSADNISLAIKIDDLTASVDVLKNQLKEVPVENSCFTKSPVVTYASATSSAIRHAYQKTNNKSKPFVFGGGDNNNQRIDEQQIIDHQNVNTSEGVQACSSFSAHQVKAAISEALNNLGDGRQNNSTEFQVVKNKNKKRRFPEPAVIGTKNDESGVDENSSQNVVIHGTERRHWLYVGRVRVGTSADSIKKYVESNFGIVDVKCFLLKEYDEICSFKVGVFESFIPELLKPEKWPKNVAVREFVMLPSNKQRPRTAVFSNQASSTAMDFQPSAKVQDKT